ncbi:secreted phosphoprotein 24 isoform X1 [Epinephelus moara]|uniref:secreted phosphoprotein 24 isoform X1 n=1 Tax=Epinephelus moara TaxID=300413 RepID=UPI00214E944B|nr:secreted phosphoprotein 24 isoform X1 [Epinephelus moara]
MIHFGFMVLDKMRTYVFLLALLQALGCSGVPVYNSELESMANRGLGAALTEVNSVYAVSHLYRVTRGSVSRVIPVGLNTADLMMVFGIKETECAKASRSDPQTCAFRPGFFVPTLSCSSRVRMTATTTQVLSLRCGRDSSSSSSESSEEKFSRGRQHFNIPFVNRDPAPAPPPTSPPVQRGFSLQMAEERQRGDTFTNFLV